MEQLSKNKINEIENEEDDEELFTPNHIDKWQDMGINVADINKLKLAGLCTVSSILMSTKKELLNIKGISDQKLEKIVEASMKIEQAGFINGNILLQKREKILKISTGSTKLNELLGGGIESMSITEIFGEFRTGKTQLCHTMSVTAQLSKSEGGGCGKVLYLDSEGTFRPEKIAKIAERFGLDPEGTLDNIIYARCHTVEHQNNLWTMAAAKMMEEHFSLMIIDSIMALFRVDFVGRGELSERQNVLGKTLNKIIKLADQFNIAVILTNQVMADPGATMTFMADPKKPIGGHILAHSSTTRLYFRKGRGNDRVCKIYDSPSLPESEAIFRISEEGIIDSND